MPNPYRTKLDMLPDRALTTVRVFPKKPSAASMTTEHLFKTNISFEHIIYQVEYLELTIARRRTNVAGLLR